LNQMSDAVFKRPPPERGFGQPAVGVLCALRGGSGGRPDKAPDVVAVRVPVTGPRVGWERGNPAGEGEGAADYRRDACWPSWAAAPGAGMRPRPPPTIHIPPAPDTALWPLRGRAAGRPAHWRGILGSPAARSPVGIKASGTCIEAVGDGNIATEHLSSDHALDKRAREKADRTRVKYNHSRVKQTQSGEMAQRMEAPRLLGNLPLPSGFSGRWWRGTPRAVERRDGRVRPGEGAGPPS